MKLVTSPNPILTQVATDWDFQVDGNGAELEKEMIEFMINKNGIGLAANQIGLLKRVFAIKLKNQEPLAMFNPTVVSSSDSDESAEEGCLSFPDLWLQVKRPSSIVSEYFDKDGNKCTITLSGLDCRCFLHELDHLNGVVFTDKVSQLKLAMAIKKQNKIRKRNG